MKLRGMGSSPAARKPEHGIQQPGIQQVRGPEPVVHRRGRQLPAPPQQHPGLGKGLGAAAQALKGIAEERGWNHSSHGLIVDIAQQVADEQGRPELFISFGSAQSLHVNFCENWLATDSVATYLGAVKALLP